MVKIHVAQVVRRRVFDQHLPINRVYGGLHTQTTFNKSLLQVFFFQTDGVN